MSYDFEKYNDGEPFDFRQEKWMEEAVKDGIKCAKDKLTLKELGIEKISKDTLAKNVELLKSLDKEFIYWISSEQQLLDAGIDKEFLAWAEYHDVVGWWKKKQKFFINMDTLISMKEFSEIIE